MKILFHNIVKSINFDSRPYRDQNNEWVITACNLSSTLGKSIEIGNISTMKKEDADVIVFIDYPRRNNEILKYAKVHDVKKYLIAIECPIIDNERSYSKDYHSIFEKVFTWSDDLVDSDPNKYIKINYAILSKKSFNDIEYRKKNCIIMCGNKFNNAKNELYTERLNCIKWFNENAPSDLDLYGPYWDLFFIESQNILAEVINRINIKLNLLKIRSLKNYKGTVEKKEDVLPLYNFSVCLENAYGYRGYITEKILDCLYCGTIPVYKGANNITEYIPPTCFIDYDKFSSISDLCEFMKNMSHEKVLSYQMDIKKFVESKEFIKFFPGTQANIVLSSILSN